MKVLNLIAIISLCPLLFYLAFESSLRKRLDKSAFIKVIQIASLLAITATPLLISVETIRSIFLIRNILATGFMSNIWRFALIVLGGWAFLCMNIFWFRKSWWYFIKTDIQTIQANWYLQKYVALDNENKIEDAYQCLQKASELKTDSASIWSTMATFNERYFHKPDLADKYLEKAQEALNSLDKPSSEVKAFFELTTGDILMSRNNINEGLMHLKNACKINPSDFNKEHYEKALKWANEDEKSEDS